MSPEQKEVIDNSSYEELFELWKIMDFLEGNIEEDVEEYLVKIMNKICNNEYQILD